MPQGFRCLALIVLVAALPVTVRERVVFGCDRCCCRVCLQPCGRCRCAVPQTACQPIVETQYAQQPTWQPRDIVATEYRTEPVMQTVPTTIVENVVVDEGSYQTVWVPRLTTRAVARTAYETRTAYRSVPYQVTQRVSECVTQAVPYQTVRYVPANTTAIGYSGAPRYATALPPLYSSNPIVSGTYPTLAASPITPTPITPTPIAGSPGNSVGGVPDARYADTPVTSIGPRGTSASRRTGSFSDGRTAGRGPTFAAPSAATVWQSNRNSAIR